MQDFLTFIQSSQWLETITPGGKASWVIEIFLVVFATLLTSYLANRVLKRVQQAMSRTKTLWDDALIDAVRRPIRTGIWLIGLTFALEVVAQNADITISNAITPIREVGIISLIAWFGYRFINNGQKNIIEHKRRNNESFDLATIDAISKLLRLSVLITAGLVMLQTLGFSISGVLAFGGISGVAVGFAAKDLLANFFGAMMIYLDRPFTIGDWIRSPDRSIEGTVEQIGWRQTRIRTFDKRPLYVPNSVFTTIAVENPSRMTNRRIKETIGIRYNDIAKMGPITDKIREMLITHEAIDETQTLMVNFNTFNASSVDFFIYCFTHTTNWADFHTIKHEILLTISNIIEEEGAEIAFPTSTLHIPDGVNIKEAA